MAESERFIPGLKVEMENVDNKSYDIADWFYTHYSHTEENKKKCEKILEKAKSDGYYEEGSKIYIIT